MRILLSVADDLLREALAHLLVAHGHDVHDAAAPTVPADLLLRDEPGGAPCGARAVLTLHAAADATPDAEPRASLARVLAEGGEVTWPAPLDARLLVDALASGGGVWPPDEREALDALLAGSVHAWWLVDSGRARILDLNVAARRLGAGSAAGPIAAARLPWARCAAQVLEQVEGLASTAGATSPAGLVSWWTPAPGRRVVGWLAAPREELGGAAAPGDLQALAELGRVSSTFAHEVRNPLASMASAIDLLKRELAPAERGEVATLAQERLDQMRAMLDDTLRLVRPFREAAQVVALETVIDSALRLARADPAFAGIRLECEGPRPLPSVQGHAEALRQALTNLLVNAAHAQGGRGTIRVRVACAEGRVLLGVQDEGPGIPEELRRKVFEPFWTTKTSGTGLGLAYVRRAAEACGGVARVAPSPRGALLELDLPEAER